MDGPRRLHLSGLEAERRTGLLLRPDQRPRRQRPGLARHRDRAGQTGSTCAGDDIVAAPGRRLRQQDRGLPELALAVQRRRPLPAPVGLRDRRQRVRPRGLSLSQLRTASIRATAWAPATTSSASSATTATRTCSTRTCASRRSSRSRPVQITLVGGLLQPAQQRNRSPAQRAHRRASPWRTTERSASRRLGHVQQHLRARRAPPGAVRRPDLVLRRAPRFVVYGAGLRARRSFWRELPGSARSSWQDTNPEPKAPDENARRLPPPAGSTSSVFRSSSGASASSGPSSC